MHEDQAVDKALHGFGEPRSAMGRVGVGELCRAVLAHFDAVYQI